LDDAFDFKGLSADSVDFFGENNSCSALRLRADWRIKADRPDRAS
jgi:hypothetical protein